HRLAWNTKTALANFHGRRKQVPSYGTEGRLAAQVSIPSTQGKGTKIKTSHTVRFLQPLNQQVIILLHPDFVPSQRLIAKRWTPNPPASVMLGAIPRRVHAGQRDVLAIPLGLGAPGLDTRDNLDAIRVCHTDVVGSDAHKPAVLLVQGLQVVVAVQLG